LSEQYPHSFANKPQCIFLNSINEQVEICNDSTNEKEYWSYTIDDYQNGFLYFHEIGYEQEEYTLFNPKNRFIKSVSGYPNLIGTKAMFAVSSEGGKYSFAYQSLENENYFEFSCGGYMIMNYYNFKNEFYFEFIPFDKKESKKYIKLTLQKI
jgi:hypothetical protein